MEQTEKERNVDNAHATEVESERILGDDNLTADFGKFKDAVALQKAYSALESEFTKRSQKLKWLEGENQRLGLELNKALSCEQARAVSDGNFVEFCKLHPNARNYADELSVYTADNQNSSVGLAQAYVELLEQKLQRLSASLSDENFLLGHIEGTAIKDNIIKGFLSDVKSQNQTAKLLFGGGTVAVSPPLKPKSLKEAGKLATVLFQKNN